MIEQQKRLHVGAAAKLFGSVPCKFYPANASNDSATILSAGNGHSEQKSDSNRGKSAFSIADHLQFGNRTTKLDDV